MADSYVLDSSAMLAFLLDEAGGREVRKMLPRAVIGTVNVAESITRLVDRGAEQGVALKRIVGTKIEIVPFDSVQAEICGELRPATRAFGLSLGDRACLALAKATGAIAVTGDRAWAKLDLGVEVWLFR